MRAFRSEAVILALLAWAAPAFAQTDQNGQAGGTPQTLQQPDQTTPQPAPDNSGTEVYRPTPSVLGNGGGAAVEVGRLGTVEGPLAGTLDDTNGGLGYNMWEGSDRATMEAMLQELHAGATSPTARNLVRRLLLTTAPSPVGPWKIPFTSLRVEKLLEAGMIGDAGELAAHIGNTNNAEIAHAQAEALLYAGRDADACGDATAYRLQSADAFWIELRAYCYAVTNDPALDLTRSMMQAQGFQDAGFMALLGAMTGTKPKLPIPIASPNAVHVRMLERLKLPMSVDIATSSVAASLVALRSPATPPNVRLAAAEKAFGAGALSGQQLSQALSLVKFTPKDLIGASAMAGVEPPFHALARLHAALESEKNPSKRTELIYAALKRGERAGLFAQAAELFADDLAALPPSLDSSNWAPTMARALLFIGNPDAAQRWYDLMHQSPVKMQDALSELQLDLALVSPSEAGNAVAQASLTTFAYAATSKNATPEAQARAALYIGLFDALGRPLGPQLQAQVVNLVNPGVPGMRPAPVQMMRVEAASLAGRRGEAVLAMLNALAVMKPPPGFIGTEDYPSPDYKSPPSYVAPDVIVRFVRALQTLGLHDAAHALAMESVLVTQE